MEMTTVEVNRAAASALAGMRDGREAFRSIARALRPSHSSELDALARCLRVSGDALSAIEYATRPAWEERRDPEDVMEDVRDAGWSG